MPAAGRVPFLNPSGPGAVLPKTDAPRRSTDFEKMDETKWPRVASERPIGPLLFHDPPPSPPRARRKISVFGASIVVRFSRTAIVDCRSRYFRARARCSICVSHGRGSRRMTKSPLRSSPAFRGPRPSREFRAAGRIGRQRRRSIVSEFIRPIIVAPTRSSIANICASTPH